MFASSTFPSRRFVNRRPNRQSRRLPKTLTANAPFQVRKNRQLVSTPSHSEGLTIRRAIRINVPTLGTSGANITYQTLLVAFQTELGIGIAAGFNLSFSPEWVNGYSNSVGPCIFAMRVNDEPRTSSATAATNTAYFSASDQSSGAGTSSICAVIPKGATYSIGDNDPLFMRNLTFVNLVSTVDSFGTVDIGGTWTIKSLSGLPALTSLTLGEN